MSPEGAVAAGAGVGGGRPVGPVGLVVGDAVQPLDDGDVDDILPVELHQLDSQGGELGIVGTERGQLIVQFVVVGVLVAREGIVASGRANGLAELASEQVERGGGINRAGAMTEHVHAGFAVGHVLVSIAAEVHIGVEAALLEHFNQDGHDIGMNSFKTVDRAVEKFNYQTIP